MRKGFLLSVVWAEEAAISDGEAVCPSGMTTMVSSWASPRVHSGLRRIELGLTVDAEKAAGASAVTALEVGLGMAMAWGGVEVSVGVAEPEAGWEAGEMRWTSRRAV